jgi:hypothetical protein
MSRNASLEQIVLSILRARAPDILKDRQRPRTTSFIHNGIPGTATVADAAFVSEGAVAASTSVNYDVLEALAYWRGVDPGSLNGHRRRLE